MIDIATLGGNSFNELLQSSDFEYGSNGNGEYWKFPNGMMICKSNFVWKGYSTVATGQIGSVQFENFWTFPHQFATGTKPFTKVKSWGNGNLAWEIANISDETKISWIFFGAFGVNVDTATNFDCIAIGRYK